MFFRIEYRCANDQATVVWALELLQVLDGREQDADVNYLIRCSER